MGCRYFCQISCGSQLLHKLHHLQLLRQQVQGASVYHMLQHLSVYLGKEELYPGQIQKELNINTIFRKKQINVRKIIETIIKHEKGWIWQVETNFFQQKLRLNYNMLENSHLCPYVNLSSTLKNSSEKLVFTKFLKKMFITKLCCDMLYFCCQMLDMYLYLRINRI